MAAGCDVVLDAVGARLKDTRTWGGTTEPGKVLVENVTARIRAGELFCLLGGSGSGKTTLLNVIAGRFSTSQLTVTGRVAFESSAGHVYGLSIGYVTQADLSIGYVTQADYLLPFLTVRETLTVTASLLPSILPKERAARVDAVILELGLRECADLLIGDERATAAVRGISGGEKRRVSVGQQLLTDPAVLCLDEPSSGLDAFTAHNLMATLAGLALKGRTLAISLHQPRSDVFSMLSSCLLLSRGRPTFCGRASEMADYFSQLGFKCPVSTNPADFCVDISSVDPRSVRVEAEGIARVARLVEAYRCSEATERAYGSQGRACAYRRVERPGVANAAQAVLVQGGLRPRVAFHRQLATLIRRFTINWARDILTVAGGFTEALSLGLVIGSIFYQQSDSLAGIRSRYGLLYITVSAQYYILMIISIERFTREIKVFDRELLDGLYTPSSYLLSHFISSLPQNIIQPLLYGVPIYFLSGLRLDQASGVVINLAAQIVLQFIMYALAWVCVSLNRQFAIASLIGNTAYTFIGLANGFFVNPTNLPPYVKWIAYVSPQNWGFRLVLTTEFSDKRFECPNPPGYCGAYDGDAILSAFTVGVNEYGPTWGALIAIFVVYSTTALICLTALRFPPTALAGPAIGGATTSGDDALQAGAEVEEACAGVTEHGLDPHWQAVNIEVREVQLVVLAGGARKVLLDNVSAKFVPGRVTGLLGGSGSGKTTLLSLLAGRTPRATGYDVTGSILFNGTVPSPSQLRHSVGFVPQADCHLPSLTVRETLRFAARLRLPRDLSPEFQLARVESVITILGLRICGDTLVGSEEIKGISGGEKRRLSLAVQLLLKPAVVLLDEPTTGLDSFTARHVVETIKQLATRGHTVVLSVHAPRSDIWALLDDVVLLSRGMLVFAGAASDILPHFAAHGFCCPASFNPADFVLDISSVDLRTADAESSSRKQLAMLVEAAGLLAAAINGLAMSPSGEMAIDLALRSPAIHDPSSSAAVSLLEPAPQATFVATYPIILYRSYLNNVRQPALISARVGQGLFFGLILSLFYAPIQNDQAGVQDHVGCLYETTALVFIGMLNCVAAFPSERNVFFREYMEARYPVLSFFTAYVTIATPFIALSSVLLSLLLTFLIGLKSTAVGFAVFSYVFFCFIFVGELIGISFCALFYHIGFGVNVMSVVISVFTMIAGFLGLQQPALWNAINYISPLKWGSWLIMTYALRGTTFTCSAVEQLPDGTCPVPNGEAVLSLYSLNASATDGAEAQHFWLLSVETAVFAVVSFWILRIMTQTYAS